MEVKRHMPKEIIKGGDDGSRAVILSAAWKLTEDDGFDGLSVNAVLRQAGLSKGTFYHWFDGRQGLVGAMLDQVLSDVSRQLEADLAGLADADAVTRLGGIMLAFRHSRLGNPRRAIVSHRFLADPRNSSLSDAIRERADQIVLPLLADTIRQGIAEGVMSQSDPDTSAELALGFWHVVEDLQMAEVNRSGGRSAERLLVRAGAALDWFERGIGLAPGALGFVRNRLDEAMYHFLKE